MWRHLLRRRRRCLVLVSRDLRRIIITRTLGTSSRIDLLLKFMLLLEVDLPFRRCFVGGLAWATNNQSLENAFSQYGEVLESKIINDPETGRSRGFGFVTFKNQQAMRDAIEGMNGQELDGRNITVNKVQSRGSGGGGFCGPQRDEG